jgi:hypothetical protein
MWGQFYLKNEFIFFACGWKYPSEKKKKVMGNCIIERSA